MLVGEGGARVLPPRQPKIQDTGDVRCVGFVKWNFIAITI